ncbi:MAG: PAS domain S-box protein [Mariniphaga sp.]|nr:PAS domain S-box protein [Mariniphaga sp.]
MEKKTLKRFPIDDSRLTNIELEAKQEETQRLEELVRQRTETLEKELEQSKIRENELQIAFDELERSRKSELLLFERLKTEVQAGIEAEKALREHQSLLETLIENAPFEIWARDKNGYGILENKVLVSHFGSILGRKPEETNVSSEVFDLWNFNNKCVLDDEIVNNESVYLINGENRNIHQILAPIKIDGNIEGIAGFNIDITEQKLAEEKIRQSEILYRTLVETSPDGIVMAELDGTLITVNRRACQIFGFKNEEELKSYHNNFIGFVAPIDVERVNENMELRLNGIESYSAEYMVVGKDRKLFPVEVKSSVVYDSHNRPYAMIGVLRDITQRRIIEDTQYFLLNAEWTNSGEDFFQLLASYLSTALEMNYVCIDRLINDNFDAQTLAVYSEGEFLKNVSYKLKDTPCGNVVGKTICCIDRNVRNMFPYDAALQKIDAECYVGTTLWSSTGKPIGLIALMGRQPLDNQSLAEAVLNLVSIRAAGELERRDTELALLQSKKAFQNYFQNCSVGMSVTSPDKKWLEVNQSLCDMLGYSATELSELTWIDVTYPKDIEKNLKLFDEVGAGLIERFEMNKRFVRKDASILYATLSTVCERNPDGSIHHLLTSYVDVTARQLAEEAILRERALLRTLIDNLPATVYVKDLHGRKTVSNKADLAHMGYSSESEVIGKTDVELYSGTDGEHGYSEDMEVIQTGIPLINCEVNFTGSNGKRHWRLTSKFPYYDDIRNVQGLVGIGFDITERKLIEDALKESEELYRNLIEKMPDGVYKSTHAGKFISVNPAMVAMLGYDSKEDLKSIDIKTQLYFEEDERIRRDSNEIEDSFDVYKMKRKDGSEVWVEDNGWYTLDEKGKTLYHEGIIRDVTDRKAVENKLRILSQAIEQNPASTVITDAAGKIEFVNTAFTTLTQYSMKEVISKPPRIFNHGHIPATDFNPMWEALIAGKVWKCEFQNRRKDGSIYWEDVAISSLMNSKGEISNYILIMDDISEKKKMLDDLISSKEKAEESNLLKSAFLATMNHELRTPLNHILGFSELIMSDVAPEDNISFASSIQISGQSLLSIIEGVFDLALVEQSNIKLRNQTFRLMDHFMENKASFDSILRASAKHEQIQLIFRPDTFWLSSYVTADRSKINQVLTNIFKNAVKFTHKGTIEFGFRIENETNLMFYITDTGIGIPKEKQAVIFDFFRQGDDSYTRGYGGIGVGLAIAKKTTQILKGELKVVSEPGQGSTFSLTIPVEPSTVKE